MTDALLKDLAGDAEPAEGRAAIRYLPTRWRPGLRWGTELDLHDDCPACGSRCDQHHLVSFESRPGDWLNFYRCRRCQSVSLRPLSVADYGQEAAPGSAADFMERFWLESGSGFDALLRPLAMLSSERIGSLLEVGCDQCIAIDFGREMLGWSVSGVDPSPTAQRMSQKLGLEVEAAYFDEDLAASRGPVDLLLAGEVLEHVENPQAFLQACRRAVGANGIVLLTTPNADAVSSRNSRSANIRMLYPGHHTLLFSKGALARMLRQAGFKRVRVAAEGEQLVAAASMREFSVDFGAKLDRAVYCEYLRRRFEALREDPLLAGAFGFRLYRELCVRNERPAAADLRAELEGLAPLLALAGKPGFLAEGSQGQPLVPSDGLPFFLPSYCFVTSLEFFKRGEKQKGLFYLRAAQAAADHLQGFLEANGHSSGEFERLSVEAETTLVKQTAMEDEEAALSLLQDALSRAAIDGDLQPILVRFDLVRLLQIFLDLRRLAAAEAVLQQLQSQNAIDLLAVRRSFEARLAGGGDAGPRPRGLDLPGFHYLLDLHDEALAEADPRRREVCLQTAIRQVSRLRRWLLKRGISCHWLRALSRELREARASLGNL